jgi:deferrochelatase/peroxidase EfeB
MVEEAGVIPRLLSIQQNRGVGYAVDTGIQVLNAIMQSGTDTQQWNTLYPMAVKAYGLEAQFTQKQANLYAAWRQAIIDKVSSGDEACLRPARYDAVLSMLFPELARRIATGFGRIQEKH